MDFVWLLVLVASFNIAINKGWPVPTMEATSPVNVSSSTGNSELSLPSWTYSDPEGWAKLYQACSGKNQSPINIDPSTASLTCYPKMVFTNYNQTLPLAVFNNGRTVLLHLPAGFSAQSIPNIRGGGLGDQQWNFVQLHFHWGNDSKRGGSEHVIQSKRYPAEMHIVHYNTKYSSYDEAILHPDGLAVLGMLIELQQRANIAFRRIIQPFESIYISGRETNMTSPIPLMDLLPDNVDNFYRYMGSLTTPGCQEIVTWTVFDTPIAISERQLAEFRKLYEDPSVKQHLENNFRPISELNGRVVSYRSDTGYPLRSSNDGTGNATACPSN